MKCALQRQINDANKSSNQGKSPARAALTGSADVGFAYHRFRIHDAMMG